MATCRKYAGLFLVLVYAFFFASTNFFYHSHQLANHKLVHSHPFSGQGHSHTASQILLIEIADSASYQEASSIDTPEFIPEESGTEITQASQGQFLTPTLFSFSLRAPPARC